MRAIIWDLCADLNRDLPRMRRRFCRLNYRGMHQRQNGAFSVLGQIPRAPNFAEFHARGGGGRLPVMPRDRIAPRGAHFSTAKRESRPRQSGCSAPRVCLGGGGGATFGRRAAATGVRAAHNGSVSAAGGATIGRSGGARRAEAGAGGQKSRTRGNFRGPRGVRGRRGPGQNRGKPGLHPGARRAKNGRNRGKTGAFGRAKRRVRRALGAKKPLFAAKKAGNGAVLGRKLAEKAGGACRVIWHLQGIFGRFRRKKLGLRKSLFTRI